MKVEDTSELILNTYWSKHDSHMSYDVTDIDWIEFGEIIQQTEIP